MSNSSGRQHLLECGFYPRTPKNFEKIMTNDRKVFLEKFRSMLIRSNGTVDWKTYIKALSMFFKFMKFNELGSQRGNRIYREYLSINAKPSDDESITAGIVSSINRIREWCVDNGKRVSEYMCDRSSMFPIVLKDLYSGSTKTCFYAAIGNGGIEKIFGKIPNDLFLEYFKKDRSAFLNDIRIERAAMILRPGLSELINSIETKFRENGLK